MTQIPAVKMPRLLNSSLGEVRRIQPASLTITENIVPLSTATLTVRNGETIPDRSWMELYTVNGSAGIYRARIPQDGYGTITSQISLEHGLCEIGDYIVKAKIENASKTLSQAISQVFAYYGGSRWQIGSVISGNVKVNTNYGDNLLTVINGLVAQIPAAMISCDFTTTPWTLNVTSRGTTVSAEGRLSRNISSAMIKKDDKDLCTRVYCEGLGTGGAVGYMDADTLSTYGIVEKKISGEGYTLAQAQAAAQSYLDKYKRPRYSITVNGDDFSMITGESLDRVAMGKLYRLAIPEDNVTAEENIIKIVWPDVYGQPLRTDLTLSEEDSTLLTFVVKQESESISRTVDTVRQTVDALNEEVDSKISKTSIYQTADQIVATAEAYTDGELTSYSTITQTATMISTAVATKLDKTATYDTVDKILNKALTDAQAAATTAANGRIAKTATYQTAEAIVSAAVAQAADEAGQEYIHKTTAYQTADAIVTEAVAQAADAADDAYIAKTTTYQDAASIVTTAVNQAATAAGNTYIAKTQTFQTADEILLSAESYADDIDDRLTGQISTMADQISLVVVQSYGQDVINAAAIMLAINGNRSQIKLDADQIDMTGKVSITDLEEYTPGSGMIQPALDVNGTVNASSMVATSGSFNDLFTVTSNVAYKIELQSITINGTSYKVCVGTAVA